MNKDGKIKLIFPPLWDTDLPYLSLPQLSAFLLKNKIENKCFDLNLYFWKKNSNIENFKLFYNWLIETYNFSIKNKNSCLDLRTHLKIERYLSLTFNNFYYNFLKNRSIIDKEVRELFLQFWSSSFVGSKYQSSINCSKEEIPLYYYHDQYFYSASLSRYALDAENIFSLTEDNLENPFLIFFDLHHQEIISNEFQYYGISVTGVNQVIPAFALAKCIKKWASNAKVIFGGAWVTQLSKKIKNNQLLFKYVDYFVVGEGEQALLKIILKGRGNIQTEIPNAYFVKENKVCGHIHLDCIDLNDLPPPSFNDYTLSEYDVKNTIPYQSSRGCSWAKCTFCSYPILDPKYRVKTKPFLLNDIKALVTKYNVTNICFVDSELNRERFETLTEVFSIIKKEISWRGFARLENNLSFKILKDAANKGCDLLIWGLESGSNEILKNLRKGTNRSIMAKVLFNSFKAGIHNRVCVMYGIFGETEDNFTKTIEFLNNNLQYIGSLAYSRFTLEYNSEMYKRQKLTEMSNSELCIGYITETLEIDYKESLEKLYLKVSLNVPFA